MMRVPTMGGIKSVGALGTAIAVALAIGFAAAATAEE